LPEPPSLIMLFSRLPLVSPPRSPLFPYTTLFRSEIVVANRTMSTAEALAARVEGRAISIDDVPDALDRCDLLLVSTGAGEVLVEDRKSTRLNSSHVAISYAAFCLKKKSDRCPITL